MNRNAAWISWCRFISVLVGVFLWSHVDGVASPPTKKSKTSEKASGATAKKAKPGENDLTGKRKELRTKISSKLRERAEIKKREGAVLTEIKKSAAKLRQEEHSLKRTNTHLTYLAEQRHTVQRQKEATQRQLQSQRRALADHLRRDYARGDLFPTQALLEPQALVDHLTLSYYAERIVDNEVQRVGRTKIHDQRLTEKRQVLDARVDEQRAVRAELTHQIVQDRTVLNHHSNQLVKVQSTLKEIEEDLAEMEAASRAIEAQIRMAQLARRGQNALRPWVGAFIRPVQGLITSGFGKRYHPILLRWMPHTGIDIAANAGTPIRAAGGGEVIFAGYMGGYGHCIVLDHGGDVSTLYAHCSELLVSKGQMVKQGQPIARVGSTGRATGPHLHFEERHNGVPVDPQRHAKRL